MHHVPKVLLYGELFPGAFRMLVSFVLLFSHVWACFCLFKFQEEATYFLLAHTVYLTMTIKTLTVDHTCRFFPSCTCPCFVPHCSSLLVQLLEKLAGNETGLLQGFKLLLDLSLQLELSKAADCPLPCKRSCVLLLASEQNGPKSKQLGLEEWKLLKGTHGGNCRVFLWRKDGIQISQWCPYVPMEKKTITINGQKYTHWSRNPKTINMRVMH